MGTIKSDIWNLNLSLGKLPWHLVVVNVVMPSSELAGFCTHKRSTMCHEPQVIPFSGPVLVSFSLHCWVLSVSPSPETASRSWRHSLGKSHRHDQRDGNWALWRKVKGIGIILPGKTEESLNKPNPELKHSSVTLPLIFSPSASVIQSATWSQAQ